MQDTMNLHPPSVVNDLIQEAAGLGFIMSSELLTGALLRTLVASKPAGEFLEIGTGVGVGTAWLLAGMDAASHLTTVDVDETRMEVARRFLGSDRRVTFQCTDALAFIRSCAGQRSFDLIFADTFPGKFEALDETLALLKRGGLYVIDDLNPQPGWGEDHLPRVEHLLGVLEGRDDLFITKMNWSAGLLVAVKR